MTNEKMKIEVWSDIACPFCYLAKHHFEAALKQFKHKDKVELEWKSFMLNPTLPDNTKGQTLIDYISKSKGLSESKTREMFDNIIERAKYLNLTFDMDKVVVANTLNAHRLSHLAKAQNAKVQNNVEELLFKAYFSDGLNVNDKAVLRNIGLASGISAKELDKLDDNTYLLEDVKADIDEASNQRVFSVPHFVFDKTHVLSGAHPPAVFLDALRKIFPE